MTRHRSSLLRLWLTPEERAEVDRRAAAEDVTPSEYVRRAALGAAIGEDGRRRRRRVVERQDVEAAIAENEEAP